MEAARREMAWHGVTEERDRELRERDRPEEETDWRQPPHPGLLELISEPVWDLSREDLGEGGLEKHDEVEEAQGEAEDGQLLCGERYLHLGISLSAWLREAEREKSTPSLR